MKESNHQHLFLEQVKNRLHPNASLVDELAETLKISRDSAYRRMRGETTLSLEEIKSICTKFKISIDALFSTGANTVLFNHRVAYHRNFRIDHWLKSILSNLEMIGSLPDNELIYYAKDLPIFHFFQFPRLTAFKIYFWMKTFTPGSMTNGKYQQDLVPKEMLSIGERVWKRYVAIPSTELLSYENLNITLRNIEFAFECGAFSNPQEAIDLCDDCTQLMDHLRSQAATGLKTSLGSSEQGAPYNLYHNEVQIGDNTILIKSGDKRITYITHNNFNILTTEDPGFCQLTEDHINNMISKGTLISHTAEKERSRFFNSMFKKIESMKRRIA